MTRRREILDAAADLIDGDRQKDYGPPEENFQRIADFWNAYLRHDFGMLLNPTDVAVLMALVKIARSVETPEKADTWIDLAGYAALAGELAGA